MFILLLYRWWQNKKAIVT